MDKNAEGARQKIQFRDSRPRSSRNRPRFLASALASDASRDTVLLRMLGPMSALAEAKDEEHWISGL